MEKKVIIYTLPTCPHCINAKKFLEENNVVFENKNVGEDRVVAKEMIIKSNQKSVPVIDIDGKIIIGFDKEEIIRELGL